MAAAPLALLPAAVLVCPPLEVTREDLEPTQAYAADVKAALAVIEKAACMPAWMRRVRIEGEAQVRPVCTSASSLAAD